MGEHYGEIMDRVGRIRGPTWEGFLPQLFHLCPLWQFALEPDA
jgi:hypothetical protein